MAREIKAYRARRGMTMREVYEAAGMPKATYIRCESGIRDINVDYLTAISRALGVSPSDLVQAAEREDPDAFAVPHQRTHAKGEDDA